MMAQRSAGRQKAPIEAAPGRIEVDHLNEIMRIVSMAMPSMIYCRYVLVDGDRCTYAERVL
jgi:hypothetical protein